MDALIAVLFLAAPIAPVSGASFDCAKASTAVEKMICSDTELSRLDGQVAEAYKKVLATDPNEWRARQHVWLTKVRNRCTEASCLKLAYEQRLSFLQTPAAPETATSYAFDKPPYVNPAIIEALTTWVSDHGEQIVAINLADSQHSNRFSAETSSKRTAGPNPYVYVQKKNEESHEAEEEFGYVYVGLTTSGVHVLRTKAWGGGSGIFEELLFVTIESDPGLDDPEDASKKTVVLKRNRKRQLIKRLGSFGLDDRWAGKVELKGNDLLLTDRGGTRTVRIDVQP